MAIDKTNVITSHELVLFMPTEEQPESFGWIRLLNGSEDAGYIWLVSPPLRPHLNSTGSYIVTSTPMSQLSLMLDILRGEPDLRIRFFDPQAGGSAPSVSIGSASKGDAAASPFASSLEVPVQLRSPLARLVA